MGARTPHRYEFGPFTMDLEDRRLARDGKVLPLTARAFDLLATLVERRGQIVTKDELFETVWAGSFVEESNLTVTVSSLRRALGDRPSDAHYIETVPKRGYRFVAMVRESSEEQMAPTPPEETSSSRQMEARATPRLRPVALAGVAAILLGLAAYVNTPERQRADTERPEARLAYLKGRHFWNKRTADGLSKSIVYYRKAIELDPDYALAYAGLADSYVFDLSDWPKAEAAARKAMELDPSLAAPYATLGFGLMFHHWDWAGAERELRRAVELDPEYATARQWYATWLLAQGRLEEARAELDTARGIDPLSVAVISDQALLAYYQHDYERAIALATEAIEIDEEAIFALDCIASCYERLGRGDEFLAARRASHRIMNSPERDAEDEAAYRAGGIKAVCLEEALMNERTWRNPDQFAYAIAQNYARAGKYDTSLGWLERSCQNRGFATLYLKVDPVFDEIRRHPRFAAVERCVGLE